MSVAPDRSCRAVTGLWQVSSRSDGDLQERDLLYIRKWSPWLDFYIPLQTVPAAPGAKRRPLVVPDSSRSIYHLYREWVDG
jgi:hypothetical protein